jgi:GNAT superfamily N-acetyltransferase
MARRQWHTDHEDVGLKAKVLKVDGAAVGRCHYGPIEISPLVGRDMTVIFCLYVHMHERPIGDQRGRGYGRAMLEAVERDAQASGALAVAAWATDGDWYPVSFYLHAGYTEVDREDGIIAVWKPFSTQAEAPRILRLPDHPPLHADKVTVLVADNDWCGGGRYKRIAREAVAGKEIQLHVHRRCRIQTPVRKRIT